MGDPADISFALPSPQDEAQTWFWDSIHCPRPLPPLAGDFFARFSLRATGHAARQVNGFTFLAAAEGETPKPDAPPSLTPPQAWEQHYLPRVMAICEELEKRDYRAMDAGALADAIPAITDRAVDALVDTMSALNNLTDDSEALSDLCEAKLGPAKGTTVAQTMLGGSANDSVRTGERISQLAALAAAHGPVAAAVRAGDEAAIAAAPGGDDFRAAFAAFLADHGRGSPMWGEIHVPTWREDPSTPLRMIAGYLEDPQLAAHAQSRTAERRDAAIREFEAILNPEEKEALHRRLAAAADTVPVLESRARWQLVCSAMTRPAILALAEKLVATGKLAAADDIFFLHAAELPAVAAGSLDAGPLVASRREDLRRCSALTPPVSLGVPLPPAVVAQIPMLRRFFGLGAEGAVDAVTLKGHGASRGTVTGRARVISSLEEAQALVPGDILVCPSTSPPWTPYFAIVAAVVTNGGGVLSHAAIEAREYGIPAVVGTREATRVIPDGATITVDGESGVVTVAP